MLEFFSYAAFHAMFSPLDELEDGHQLWWKTAKSVLARLVNDLCRRSRGIEGTVSESEMDRERGTFMKLSYVLNLCQISNCVLLTKIVLLTYYFI